MKKDSKCQKWFQDKCKGFGDIVNGMEKENDKMKVYEAANTYMMDAQKDFVKQCPKVGTKQQP